MVQAFVMVATTAGESERVRDATLKRPGVREAHVVAGEFDIIVEVESDEVTGVLDAAASGIQSIEGVTDTKTYVSLN
jgi:DNA-binding Lrp family transcriptional regulator